MTRFNLATPGREAAYRSEPTWLSGRFDLFERYCLPSVAAQNDQDFQWIVYFSDETPDWARERIAAAQKVRPFHACFTPLFDASGWARTVRDMLGPPRPGGRIVTSNLDNDDGLARDYLARVRSAAEQSHVSPPFAINVPEGIVLSGRAAYRHRHLHNAFTNLVEMDDDAFATTMTIRHMELAEHVRVVQADDGAGWLQVVHEGNVSNRIRGRRFDPATERAAFPQGALSDATPPRSYDVVVDWLAAPLRTLRDRGFALARRFIRVS